MKSFSNLYFSDRNLKICVYVLTLVMTGLGNKIFPKIHLITLNIIDIFETEFPPLLKAC